MKNFNDEAIIIRVKQVGESDKIITALSKYHATISAIAKGASRSKSRKVTSIDLLNHVKLNIYKGKNLDILREVQLLNDFSSLKSDPVIINDLLYILEIIQKLEISYIEEDSSFALLFDFLTLLENNPSQKSILISAFELKLIELSGYSPNLDEYIDSNEKILPNEIRVLSKREGLGYVKSNSKKDIVLDQVIKVQRFILKNKFNDVLRLNLSLDLIHQIKFIHRFWIESIVEKRLKSIQLLKD